MRSRITSITSALVLIVALVVPTGLVALGQSVGEAERELEKAERRSEIASGLVDEAVANRAEIELQIAESISRANDLAASLSVVGARLDSLAGRMGVADIEMVGLQEQIEMQAVDAYMAVLASPSMSLVSSSSVERALVVSAVVDDVIAGGRERVSDLFIRKRAIQDLHSLFLSEQVEFQEARAEVDQELEHLARLYEEADRAVADAIRAATIAAEDRLAAMTALDVARAQEEERRRQEERSTTTTTRPPSPTTTRVTTTTTTVPGSPTTTIPGTTTTTAPTTFPPQIEQWRPLVSQYFPANRVTEALKILRCESNGNPNALNPYSQAAGLFQFLPSTWATTAPQAGFPNASPFDPVANVASAAWLANRYEQLGLYYWQAWSCRRVL